MGGGGGGFCRLRDFAGFGGGGLELWGGGELLEV